MKRAFFILVICFQTLSIASEEISTTESQTVSNVAISRATASENEIPIHVDQVKASTEVSTTTSKLLLTGVVVSLMLLTSYYFVRKYKTSNKINKSNMQIKVLSQHYLGPKKSLAIIRVAGESMLIGVTDSNISMIKSLSLLDEELPTVEIPQTFVESMDSHVLNKTSTASTEDLEEEFSFASVKDTVSKKLKSMRSLS